MPLRTEIQNALFSLQDEKYRLFQCKLMPTVPEESVIGVRTPLVRKYAKEIAGTPLAAEFLTCLPHTYYEENNLHAFLIERVKDFDLAVQSISAFLPFVDNWATCDSMSPKVLGKHKTELLAHIEKWLADSHPYTVRFGIEMLMSWYLDADFSPEYPEKVAVVESEEYYVNMMRAWYFATALAKHYDTVLPFLLHNRLDTWTHNKTIQKAVESYRITEEQKAFLRTLRIK